METSTTIPIDHAEEGWILDLECFVCGERKTYISGHPAKSAEECVEQSEEDGWRYLESDKMKTRGHWCGCKY